MSDKFRLDVKHPFHKVKWYYRNTLVYQSWREDRICHVVIHNDG